MMSSFSFFIAYDGPALAESQMDINDLAPALLSLSDAFSEANTALNGDKAEIHLNVKGSFKTGCFGIDLSVTQSLLATLSSLVSEESISKAADIATLIGFASGTGISLLALIRRLKNRKINKIESQDGKCTLYIDEEQLVVETKVLKLYQNYKIRNALDNAIRKPLEKKGINSFACSDKQGGKIVEAITKEEANYFTCPKEEPENLGEEEHETTLQLLSPNFQEGNKWRFSDGSATFFAKISDRKFLDAIDNREYLFGKGDILKVRIREKKRLETDRCMSSEKEIIKVISFRPPNIQLKLPGVKDSAATENKDASGAETKKP